MKNITVFEDKNPLIGKNIYLDAAAKIIGDVRLADEVSIWPFACLRGDVNYIEVGARTNIQDGTIIHVSHEKDVDGGFPTIIGSDVTVGHAAMLHGCVIGEGTLIGMRAIVLDGAKVGAHSILGAGALLAPNKKVPSGELWVGSPARFVRRLSDVEIEELYYSARHYCTLKDRYIDSCKSTD